MQLIAMLVVLQAAPSPADVATWLQDTPGKSSAPTLPVVTKVEGVNVTQSTCTSTARLDTLQEHFGKLFAKAGLYIPEEQSSYQPEVGAQLTGLDPDRLVSYTVLLQPSGKAVTVVLAAAEVGVQKMESVGEPIAPLMPGARDLTSFKLEGISAMSYAVHATPADIKTFYRTTLKQGGWAEGAEALTFIKGTQELSVVVSPGVSEQYVMVQLKAR